MYCGYCRTELKGKEKFCPKCGKELPKVNIAIEMPKKRKSTKKICIIVGFLLVLLAVCIAVIFYFRKNGDSYLALVKDAQGKYGYINEKGEEVIECKFDFASPFMTNGLATFGVEIGTDEDNRRRYKYGFINTGGEKIVPAIYDDVDWECCGSSNEMQYIAVAKLINAEKDGKSRLGWGWMDKSGKLVVECKYDSFTTPFWKNGMCVVNTNDKKCGIIDQHGNEIIQLGKYAQIGTINEDGLIAAAVEIEDDWKWGVIDLKENQIVPYIYDYTAVSSDNGWIHVMIEEGNRDGEIVEKWRYLDKGGQEIYPTEYSQTTGFMNGYAFVNEMGNYRDNTGGYINELGDVVTQCKYCYGFKMDKNGRAIVAMNDDEETRWNYGLIDSTGREIVPCGEWYLAIKEGHRYGSWYIGDYWCQNNTIDNCIIQKEDRFGLLNNEGKTIIPSQYDMMWYGDNGWFAVGNIKGINRENDYEDNEYIMSYLNERGNIMLQLPEKYIFASEFTKIENRAT